MEKSNKSAEDKKLIFVLGVFLNISLMLALCVMLLFIGFLISETLNRKSNTEYIGYTPDKNIALAGSSTTKTNYWKAPSLDAVPSGSEGDLILYGRELVAHTAYYFGPKGSLNKSGNGINCQNCHLEAGTKIFGNNFGAVAATYPQLRARSEKLEDIPFRVNDCFQRSLNGEALPLDSKEMKAIVAYIKWVGKDVNKNNLPDGLGFIPLKYMDRAADPEKGRILYETLCITCHGIKGDGKKLADGIAYEYPPLWGTHSYNVGAGLYRIEKMARFLKSNMPNGVDYKNPKLTDEEAWDIAAYLNSQEHPVKRFPQDWPNLMTKAVDVPFGPYADGFSEKQHKYGPFPPIIEKMKKLKAK
jgi:thiosulfate dehydrogenase